MSGQHTNGVVSAEQSGVASRRQQGSPNLLTPSAQRRFLMVEP